MTHNLKDDGQTSEKADSGMDDDSQQSHEQDVHCKGVKNLLCHTTIMKLTKSYDLQFYSQES